MAQQLPLLMALVKRFPDTPKEELYARVLCGSVTVDGEVVRDPKCLVGFGATIEIAEARYVSRGGIKLAAALRHWRIDLEGRVALDVGASTGGFTDCILRHGARLVHAVDVGSNLIAYRLRVDSRVRVYENTNIMNVSGLSPIPDIAFADVSFRSLRGAATHLLDLAADGIALVLAKPQFEWLDPPASFRGVVEGAEDLRSVLLSLALDLQEEGVGITGMMESPIRGRKGNREFFFLAERGQARTSGRNVVAQIEDVIS